MNWLIGGICLLCAIAYCVIDVTYMEGAMSGIVGILAFFAGAFCERAIKEGKQKSS